MEPIRLGPFLGANKTLALRLLPATVGADSVNHRPDKGDLRPWKAPLAVKTGVSASVKTLAILPRDDAGDTIYWLVWTSVVHAVRGLLAEDTTQRVYYSGSGAPKVTDNVMGLAGEPYPTAYRDLGIPKPLTKPTVSETTAGTGDDKTVYFAYAYVSDWGEIGMPQLSDPFTCKPGAELVLSNLALPPSGPGENRGIDRIRIWQTVSGNSSSSFYFLADRTPPAISTTVIEGTTGDDALPSATWAMPPADLSCLTGLWNGIMAGISGNAVRYCEPFKPYAWPAAYETLCTDKPIALGVFDKGLVIATTGRPRLVYGTVPEAMDDAPIELLAACVSVRSMVSLGHGVCWATPDGLAYVGSNGAPRLLTANCMTVDDWQALNPSSIVGAQFKGRYFGFYDDGSGIKGFMVDPGNPDGIYFLAIGYSAALFDPLGERLYVLDGTTIKQFDGGATPMTASFRSKVFRLPAPDNPGAAEVIADAYPVGLKVWAGVHGGEDGWPAGSLRADITVTSRDPFTLPGGYLADDLQFEVRSTKPVQGVVIAATFDELKVT